MNDESEENEIKEKAVKAVAKRKTKAAQTILEGTQGISDDSIAVITEEKRMLRMANGEAFYAPGISFTKKDPFCLVPAAEAEKLVEDYDGRFVVATKKMVEQFYLLA